LNILLRICYIDCTFFAFLALLIWEKPEIVRTLKKVPYRRQGTVEKNLNASWASISTTVSSTTSGGEGGGVSGGDDKQLITII